MIKYLLIILTSVSLLNNVYQGYKIKQKDKIIHEYSNTEKQIKEELEILNDGYQSILTQHQNSCKVFDDKRQQRIQEDKSKKDILLINDIFKSIKQYENSSK